MRRNVLLLVTILLAISCKNGQKSNQQSENTGADSCTVGTDVYRGPVTIHIDDKIVPLYDTLTLNNLIESVRYIPLETSDSSIIDAQRVRKIDDIYCVTSDLQSSMLKLFDSNGRYIRSVFRIGRARNEISILSLFIINAPGREIIASSVLDSKFVTFNIDSLTYRTVYNENFEINRPFPLGKGHYVAKPDNNRAVLGPTITETYDSLPHLMFYDSDFNITGTVGDGAKPWRDLETTEPPRLTTNVYESGDGVTYRYADGDTVFTVDADEQMVPAIILDIPDKLKPTIKQSETDPASRKQQMIYVEQFQLSRDYVFIEYQYGGKSNSGIWSRDNGQLLFLNTFTYGINPILISVDGFSVQRNVNYLNRRDNVIITPIDASYLVGTLPGVKDDDNPVIMEITLRSDKH